MNIEPQTDDDEYATPSWLVAECLDKLKIHIKPNYESILDPCAGTGAWFKEFNKRLEWETKLTHYCEILEGTDFYNNTDVYDVVVGNPPFSQITKWLEHSMNSSLHLIGYILPAHSLSHNRLSLMEDFGWSMIAMHSFPNPKEWKIGFAHFFVIWEYNNPYIVTSNNEVIQKNNKIQTRLAEWI